MDKIAHLCISFLHIRVTGQNDWSPCNTARHYMQTHMWTGGAVVQALILKTKNQPSNQTNKTKPTHTNNPKTFLGLHIARLKSLTAQNSEGKVKHLFFKKKILVQGRPLRKITGMSARLTSVSYLWPHLSSFSKPHKSSNGSSLAITMYFFSYEQ